MDRASALHDGNSNCSRYPLPSNATTITVSTTISTMAIITTATSASLPSEKTAEIVTTDPAQKTTTTTSSSASIITARTTKDTSPMTTERDAEEPSTNEGVTDVSDIVDGKPGNSQMITGNSSCKHLSWKMSLVVLVLLLIFT
ncbi:hypothetical protein SK128_026188 [Halocaridina rubra]|uniref:Uncharacterized protein n=1 Tax=Halocaridina rubra TaxID=373956 RepID=A0AAN9AGU0_HALRR